MTNSTNAYNDSTALSLDSMIDLLILAPECDPDNDAISSADLIEQILECDQNDPIEYAILFIAFDILDLDDEMLIDRIQSRIDLPR